jgi:hypothetical protein
MTIYSFLFWLWAVCMLDISTKFWHYVVTEAESNWYIFDVNIFFQRMYVVFVRFIHIGDHIYMQEQYIWGNGIGDC